MAIDANRAAGDVVKARHQIGERGFPAAAGAHQRHHFARLHFQTHAAHVKSVGRVRIAEIDIIEAIACWNLPSFAAPGFSTTLLIAIQVFENLLRRAERLLENVVDAGEALHRLIEHQQRDDEAGEIAGGQCAALDLGARVGEQADDGERAEHSISGDESACWAT